MPLDHQLTALETSGLLRRADLETDLTYLFRHGLIQDAAYASLLKADRKALHLAIGETLEHQYPQQLPELAPTLAHHFALAEATPRARHYLTLAADAALANYANAEAERHYRAALDLTETAADRARLLAGLGEALLRQSKFEQADLTWRAAITICQALGDYAGVARLYARAARTAGTGHSGDAPRALALCREGLAAIAGQPTSPAQAMLLHEAGRACYFTGLVEEARTLSQQALTLAEQFNDLGTQAETLATLWGLLPIASPEAAIEGLQRAARLAETAGHLETAARIYHNLGFRLGIELGELETGCGHIGHALEILRRIGDESGQFYSMDVVVVLSFLLGNFAEVEKHLKTMSALLPAVGNPPWGVVSLSAWEAWLLRCRGERAAAREAFRGACAALRQHQTFDTLANINCTLADLLLELNELDQANEVLQETLELVARGFMEPVEPRCLIVAVYARQGRLEEAQRVLGETREQAGPTPGTFNALALNLAQARLAAAGRQWSTAFEAFEAVCAHAVRHHIRWHQAQALSEWAEAHVARNEAGDVEQARRLFHESRALFEAIQVPRYAALVQARLLSLAPDAVSHDA